MVAKVKERNKLIPDRCWRQNWKDLVVTRVWSEGRGVRETEQSRTVPGFGGLRNSVPDDTICWDEEDWGRSRFAGEGIEIKSSIFALSSLQCPLDSPRGSISRYALECGAQGLVISIWTLSAYSWSFKPGAGWGKVGRKWEWWQREKRTGLGPKTLQRAESEPKDAVNGHLTSPLEVKCVFHVRHTHISLLLRRVNQQAEGFLFLY